MAGYGMLILGPSLHFWFNFVSKTLPKRDTVTTLKKIVLGQTIYGPIMTVVFFSVNAVLQGSNVLYSYVLLVSLFWSSYCVLFFSIIKDHCSTSSMGFNDAFYTFSFHLCNGSEGLNVRILLLCINTLISPCGLEFWKPLLLWMGYTDNWIIPMEVG